ncbi:MAG: hypothetical protein EBZ77_15225 [Chitinophagia bacterium]|nr:hypothetical protein [Chitinophagia bacterium]
MQQHWQKNTDSINEAGRKRTAWLTKKYGARRGKLLAAGQIATGMTPGMVRDAWGDPMVVQENVTKQGNVLFWRYGVLRWVRFLNGRIIAYSY